MENRDDQETQATFGGNGSKTNAYNYMSRLFQLATNGDENARSQIEAMYAALNNNTNQGTSEGSGVSSSEATRKRKYSTVEDMYDSELAKGLCHDLSDSSAHLDTGHAKPDEIHYEELPTLLELPYEAHEKICEQCTHLALRKKRGLNETDFHFGCFNLVMTVLEYSGLEELVEFTNATQFFDVITDFTILLKRNLYPIGGGEVKKGKCSLDPSNKEKNEKVYGQVVNQMASMTLNGPKSPPMLLTTLNQWQLSLNRSMKDIEGEIKEIKSKLGEIRNDPTILLQQWNSKEAQESPQPVITAPESLTPKPNKARKGSTIASLLNPESRVVYNSRPVEFPTEAKNVVNLIYTWLLLALRGCTNRNTFDPFATPITAPCRALNIGRGDNPGSAQYFCIKFGHLEKGVDFKSKPSGNQKLFLLWSPLGFTDNSMCCFATNNHDGFTISTKKKEGDTDGKKKEEADDGKKIGHQSRDSAVAKKPRKSVPVAASPCAIKFFKGDTNETNAQAKRELKVWRDLYPSFSFVAVNVLFDTTYLVMPYLQAFSCEERGTMVNGEDGQTKLKAAFRWLYAKGYKYEDQDIRWRHIGWYWINGQRQIGFCDFGAMIDVRGKDSEAQAWSESAVRKLAQNASKNANAVTYVQDSFIPDSSVGIANLTAPE